MLSIGISIAVVVLRRVNQAPDSRTDPSITLWLIVVVVLSLIGALFLFLGLFE